MRARFALHSQPYSSASMRLSTGMSSSQNWRNATLSNWRSSFFVNIVAKFSVSFSWRGDLQLNLGRERGVPLPIALRFFSERQSYACDACLGRVCSKQPFETLLVLYYTQTEHIILIKLFCIARASMPPPARHVICACLVRGVRTALCFVAKLLR